MFNAQEEVGNVERLLNLASTCVTPMDGFTSISFNSLGKTKLVIIGKQKRKPSGLCSLSQAMQLTII